MDAALKREGLGPDDILDIHQTVEVREQRIPARYLPFQRIAQGVRVDRNQKQTLNTCKVFCCCLGGLGGGGEMDVAISHVDRSTCGLALIAQGLPFVGAEYFEYEHRDCDAFVRRKGQGLLLVSASARGASYQGKNALLTLGDARRREHGL